MTVWIIVLYTIVIVISTTALAVDTLEQYVMVMVLSQSTVSHARAVKGSRFFTYKKFSV